MTDYRRLQNARIKISLPSSSVRTARNALACRPLLRGVQQLTLRVKQEPRASKRVRISDVVSSILGTVSWFRLAESTRASHWLSRRDWKLQEPLVRT